MKTRVFMTTGLLILLVTGNGLSQKASEGDLDPPSKIHFRLQQLMDAPLQSDPDTSELLRFDEQGRVQVYIRVAEFDQAVVDGILGNGGAIDRHRGRVVQAWLPIEALETIALLSRVLYIEPPQYVDSKVGSVTTAGDVVQRFDQARGLFGVNGAGIRVGVVADGLKGLEASISTGDLPPTTFRCQTLSMPVIERSNGCLASEKLVETRGGVTGKPITAGEDLAAGAEGTAMLEIIHDLAPGAELWLVSTATSLDLADGWEFLAGMTDVVVSDLVTPGFFPNGQSTVTQQIAEVTNRAGNRARAYVQAIGNQAEAHYSGIYADSGFNPGAGNYHSFAANQETDGPATPSTGNEIAIGPRESVGIVLTWDDPAAASTNDYDLVLTDCDGRVLDESSERQNGFQEPLEAIVGGNESFASVLKVCYHVRNFQNHAAAKTLNVHFFLAPILSHEYNTSGKSLEVPADTPGDFIAVGAVPASSPDTIEPFSSRGPTFDGRPKPDLVATDDVSVSGAGGFPEAFPGTSAAAPHVAGLAALLLEIYPDFTRSGLKTLMMDTAFHLGEANVFGAGRIDALDALTAAAVLTFTLDIDGNGKADALTDGLLVVRHLFEFTGGSLIGGGVVAGDCSRCTAEDIESYLQRFFLDVDGNGQEDALTDGILTLRYLFGFRGISLIQGGVVANDCVRCSAAEIEAFLAQLLP